MRRLFATVVLGSSLALAACGGDGESSLIGYVPPSVKDVSSASVNEVTDSGNNPFVFKAAAGELLVVYFGYTHCPDLCPTTLAAVRSAKRDIGADLAARVDLAMVTVDPERDTDEILPKYLSSFSERYHALIPTSDEELKAAEALFQASSSVTKDAATGEVKVGHSATAYVVNDMGRVVVEWPYGLEAESMAKDLRLLFEQQA